MEQQNKTLLLHKELFAMQDISYKQFHQKLIPTISADCVIGIRTPLLRRYAKSFAQRPEAAIFLQILPHTYYEENNLHAFVLETGKDFDETMAATERFLPYIDNWATCDMFFPKVLLQQPDVLYQKTKEWLLSDKVYTVRFGLNRLLAQFLDERFKSEMLELAAAVSSDEYYIQMAQAWYFSIALIKQYDTTLPFLLEHKLSPWVHNKTIQKSIESLRVSPKIKTYLKTLKIPTRQQL